MAMSQASAEALERYRKQLRAAERDPVDRITNARTAAMEQIRDEVNAVLAAAVTQGITSSAVAGLPQYRRLLQLIDDHLIGLGRVSAGPIEQAQREAIAAADAEARAFAAGQTRSQARAERLNRAWRAVPDQEINDYVGKVPDGTAFAEEIARIGPDVGQVVGDDIANGLYDGLSATAILDRIDARVEAGFRRALWVAENAIYDGSRWAMDRLLAENAGELAGGRRVESLDSKSCRICWALHGKKYAPGEPFERHMNCRGLLVPLLMDGVDLGIEPGEVVLRRQPEAVQLSVFDSKKAHMAWVEGRVDLIDFVQVNQTRFGPQAVLLGLDRASRQSRFRKAGGTRAVKQPKPVVPGASPYGMPPEPNPAMPGHWIEADRILAEQDIKAQPESWRALHRPQRPFGIADYHLARNIDGRTQRSGGRIDTDVAEDWVPVRKELAAINRGDGTKLNDNDYEINGRIYHQKSPSSTSGYIRSGPGVHSLNNAEVYLLGLYNDPYMTAAGRHRAIQDFLSRVTSGHNPTVVRQALVEAISDGIE